VDALHDAADFGVEPAAHLLAALAPEYPRGSIFLTVVDPGVGGKRDAIVVRAAGRTFVGPDNGLLSVLWQRAYGRKCFRIVWKPQRLARSFHGRDLFAPVAAALAAKRLPKNWLNAKRAPDALLDAGDLAQVIYVDHYGNCVTGIRAQTLPRTAALRAGARVLRYARTFDEARGAFWYENSLGLVELALPRGSAQRTLGLRVGYAIRIAR
jgi:S-adenosyl-L-methionine hydrolase (adenosine-forming)